MSRGAKLAITALAAFVVLTGGVVWYLGPIAPIATGYAAKTVCSGHLVAERGVDDALGDLPDNPLVPFLRVDVDDPTAVTATLLGAWGATAYRTEGLGCTLAEERPAFTALDPLPPPASEQPWPQGSGPAQATSGISAAQMDAAINLAFVEDDPSGRDRNTRAVVVIKDGRLVAERYAPGFGPDTPLLGWSMAKSVAGAMVGRLVADGRLSTEDDGLRPSWTDDARRTITVEHLLTMTDGLSFEEMYDPDTDATRMLFLPGDAGDYAAQLPLEAEPGTRWAYSSGTTNILCDVAQEAADTGPELARSLVFEPLGMATAVMEPDAAGGLVCSSYLYATARDWARFGQWYLQDGVWEGERLLPEGWVERSTTPVDLPTEYPYGWQWWLNTGPDGEQRMPSVPSDAYWASGNEGQQVVIVPSEDLVVVRLGFSGGFSGIAWGLEPMLRDIIEAAR